MDTNPDHADTTVGQESPGWRPLDCLHSLGRAVSIAAGGANEEQDEFHCFRIAVVGRSGAYCARVTHYLGKAVRLPASLRHQLDARFPSMEEASQHARFLITSGALKPVQRG